MNAELRQRQENENESKSGDNFKSLFLSSSFFRFVWLPVLIVLSCRVALPAFLLLPRERRAMRSGAAYLGGVKGNYATIGLTASVPLNDCPGQNNTGFHVASIAKWAQDYGMSTGENELYSLVFYDFESAAQPEAHKSVPPN